AGGGALGSEANDLAACRGGAVVDDGDDAEGLGLSALPRGRRALLFEALEDVLNDAVERVFELIGLPEERVGQQLAPLLVELEELDVERALGGLRPVDAGVRQELAGPLVAEDDLVTGLRLTVREDLLEEELSEARIGGRRNRGRGGVVVAEDIVCA